MAEILDAAGLAWDYEPHTFPLEHDRLGRVTRAFTPDFFLPEAQLYIELTTQPPKHLTRKRRKVRETQRRFGAVVVLHERLRFEQLCARYLRQGEEPSTTPTASAPAASQSR